MESIIKWQTGTPKEPGKYLISDKHYNVDSDWWTRKDGWDRHYDEDVMGWCKLSDIDSFNYITQEEKSNLIPHERYANAYIETWTDINGVKHEDFKLGGIYENKEDLPNYYEISYARAIHLGAVKIEIKPL